ncbi:MAG TPA: hypothetical protein VLA22_10520 [Gaiellaceae bacterium]|nr:hypothetical protein [Gaiellaceae bacterium]
MRCPWCEFDGPPRSLHGHLADVHPEHVRFEEGSRGLVYAIECPTCGAGYEKAIKPRSRDPAFIEEYEREVRLVGFDMLINHLLAEHEDT